MCGVCEGSARGLHWYTELVPSCSLQGSKGGSLSAEGGPLAAPGVAPSLTLMREFSNAVDRTGAWLLCCRYLHQMQHETLCKNAKVLTWKTCSRLSCLIVKLTKLGAGKGTAWL